MRFERFKTLADMLAFAVKTSLESSGKVCAADISIYEDGISFRPCVILTVEGGDDISLRWYAYADQTGIDFYGKRARVEARDAAAWFQHQVQEAINAAGTRAAPAVDLRRAPLEILPEFPADVCRTIIKGANGEFRVNYGVLVFATEDAPPAIGEVVTGVFNRIGDCRVTGYFSEGGYVGVTADLLSADVIARNNGKRGVFLFPTEYRKAAAPAGTIKAGDSVSFSFYGEEKRGTVDRVANGIVWLTDGRWLHLASVSAIPAGWSEIEAGPEGTSLEAIDANAATAMANPGQPVELFEGCTMIVMGGEDNAATMHAMLAEAFGESQPEAKPELGTLGQGLDMPPVPEPKHKLCAEFFGGLITLQQRGTNNFAVRYGLQIDTGLGYDKAASMLGGAIMHYLACESKLDNA